MRPMTDTTQRSRSYVGYYDPPPPRDPPPPQSIEDRIAVLIDSVVMARDNARRHVRDGDFTSASAAFYRAHEYVENIRFLRARL